MTNDEKFDLILSSIGKLTNKFDNLENRFDNLENKVDKIEKEQTRINMVIENDIKKNIDIIIENYEPAAKAMVEKVADIDSLKTNVQLLNRIVAEHCDRLDKMSEPA